RKYLADLLVLVGGAFLGLFVLYCIYRWNGVWDDFLRVNFYQITIVGENSLQKKLSEFYIKFGGFFRDASFLIVLTVAGALALRRNILHSMKLYSLLAFGLVAAIVIPVGIFVAGAYPIYYSWMAYLPLSICTVAELDSISDSVSPIKRLL